MEEEAIIWIKLGHLSLLDVLDADIFVERLENRRWQIFQQTWYMISTEPPFTTELKMFGPFMVKHYRKEMKRCGVMFTCLSSCAVHLEVVQNMETDWFIQALREFIACQGNTRLIRCDSGTNFVDAKSEHQRSLSEMEEDNITSLTEWWNLLGHIEEQSSFRKLHGRGLGAPDKISMCGTINITKSSPYKFEPRITNHTTDRCWISSKVETFNFGNLEWYWKWISSQSSQSTHYEIKGSFTTSWRL